MIRLFFKYYSALIFTSLFCNSCIYMSAYSIQSKYNHFPRFSKISPNKLGRWKHFIVFPQSHLSNAQPFILTVDGEKWALIHLIVDLIAFPLIILLLAKIKVDNIYSWCFYICEVPFAIFSFWIHFISNRILSLPREILITDSMLSKHIAKAKNQLCINHDNKNYRVVSDTITKKSFWETREIIEILVFNKSNECITRSKIATKNYSRYYEGNEITLIECRCDDTFSNVSRFT